MTRIVQRVTVYVVMVTGALTMLIPLLWCVSSSLKPYYNVFLFPPQWIPSPVYWQNYTKVFQVTPFARWYYNTAVCAFAVTCLMLLTSSAAGYAFARLQFPGRDRMFVFYLATMMIPGQVTLIPSFILVQRLGWVDTYRALIIPASFGAFGTFFMRQFFLSTPQELRDAALIDGCSHYAVFWRIILPLAGPALATLGIFSFVSEWNSFLWPLIVLRSPRMWLISVGLRTFSGEYFTEWGLLMAGSCLALFPVLLVYVAAQKYFVRSISFSGIKG